MAEITLTADNFEQEVIRSELPVLVDFWATWCGPCRMVGPVVAEIAEEYEGKIKVGKVNVDDEVPLAAEFEVSAIPTIVRIDGGKVTARTMGYQSLEQLEAALGLDGE